MRRLRIALPNTYSLFYGLILGTFAIGLHLKGTLTVRSLLTKPRSLFSLIAARILKHPHTLFGVCTGSSFRGFGNLPKYTRSEITETLVDLSCADAKYTQALLKFDSAKEISPEVYTKVDRIRSGKEELPDKPINLVVSLGGPAAGVSGNLSKPHTKRTQANYSRNDFMAKMARRKAAALSYQEGLVSDLREQLSKQEETLTRMKETSS